MTADRTTLRAIAWRELFPWLMIVRTFSLAIALPLLLIATAAVAVQPLGWNLAALLFTSQDMRTDDPSFDYAVRYFGGWPSSANPNWEGVPEQNFPFWPTVPFEVDGKPLTQISERISLPFGALFLVELPLPMFAYFLFGGLWTLLLWAFVGGMITRIAVVYLGREERVGLKDAALFVAKKYLGSYFVAPLYPLIGVVLLTLPLVIVGWLMMLDFGVVLAGLLWIFVLMAALAMAFLLIGLLFGWPLMWPTISAENGDAFEALSRSYGYTFQRPFHYLFYVLVAGVVGFVAWWIVKLLASMVVALALWGVSWGVPGGSLESPETSRQRVVFSAIDNPERLTDARILRTGANIIRFCNGLVYCTALGFAYSFFFCAASAIYLLLRQVDDETEFDEVYVEEELERMTLPDLNRGADAAASPPGGLAERNDVE